MTPRAPLDAVPAPLDAVVGLREAYRREMGCQIVHDSWHARGFTDAYVLRAHDRVVGYGSVGGAPRETRDLVKEFFVLPPFRGDALALFRRLVAVSGARAVEAQTNDVLLTLMLFDCAVDLSSETILFAEGGAAACVAPDDDAILRRVTEADHADVFPHVHEPVGEWGLEAGGALVATGGLALHYNPPYADLFMEVDAAHRRRGLGTRLVRELVRLCRDAGRIPAARCHQDNVASRRTLERAGMVPCARVVRGRLAV